MFLVSGQPCGLGLDLDLRFAGLAKGTGHCFWPGGPEEKWEGGATKIFFGTESELGKMKQIDVDVSPPANIMGLRLTLTCVTFDLDPSDL